MSKKGFTLIEVLVSVVLVSIVMISLLGSLIQLRSTYSVIHENSDVIVYSSSISRVINNDLAKNNGIRYVSCDTDGQLCEIILGNDSKRKLEIVRKETTTDGSNLCVQSGSEFSNVKTTLKYIDTTKNDDNKLIYLRTLESSMCKKNNNVSTKGYNFQDMSASQLELESVDNLIDQYTTIVIKLNNLENENLSKYDIVLYAAGRYDYDNLKGKKYVLQLNDNGATTAGTDEIVELFGIGYFESLSQSDESIQRVGSQIRSITIPKKSNQAFMGYYYKPRGVSQEIQVIDSRGRIVTNSRRFREEVRRNLEQSVTESIIIAKWTDCNGGYEVVNGECRPKQFLVELDKNNGTGGTDNYRVYYNALVQNVTIPKRAGYTFGGYFLGSQKFHDETGVGKVIYSIPHDSTISAGNAPKADWKKCLAGTFSDLDDTTCIPCIKNSTSPEASGRCFACAEGTENYENGSSSCTPCSNAANVATWKTPAWSRNGSTQSVTNICSINTCNTGYNLTNNKCVASTFTVNLNSSGATTVGTTSVNATYNSATISPASITLAQKKYTVSGFGLAASRNSDNATVSSTAALTSSATLNGYYTAASGGSKVLNASTTASWVANVSGYTDSSKRWVRNGVVTLYAQFGAQSSVTLPTITKAGYTCGWTTSSTGTTIQKTSGANITPTANTVYYGVCVASTYTVTLSAPGATSSGTTSVSATYNSATISPSSITLAQKKYTASGFGLAASRNSDNATVSSTTSLTSSATLNGYYTAASGGSKVLNASTTASWVASVSGYTDASKRWTKAGSTTLYARFGTQSAITLPTITKTGYTCGWTTSSSGTNIEVASGAKITPTANTIYYGVCEPIEYVISYNVNGGTGVVDSTKYKYAPSGNVALSSTVPTRSGYVFVGWATSQSSMVVNYASGAAFPKNIANNTVLYAVWARWSSPQGYYQTLADAVSTTSAGGEIKLLVPYTSSESVTISKQLKINLSGKKLTRTAAININSSGNVTFNGTGTLEASSTSAIINSGSLTLSVGTFTNTIKDTPVISNSGTLTVSGATITQSSTGCDASKHTCVGVLNSGTMTLSSGTIENTTNVLDQAAVTNKKTFTQSGGTLRSTSESICLYQPAGSAISTIKSNAVLTAETGNAIWAQGGTVNIEGGTISSNSDEHCTIASNGTLNISGGTITQKGLFRAIISDGGTFKITGGTVSKTRSNYCHNCVNNSNSAVVSVENGTGTIAGGTIGPSATNVYGITALSTGGSTVTMTGGTLRTYSNATYYGRTVSMGSGAIFNYNGGTISYQASGSGNQRACSVWNWGNPPSTFNKSSTVTNTILYCKGIDTGFTCETK